MVATYKEIAAHKQKQQRELIPKAWRLRQLPDESVLDVRSIPRTCGLLSEHELDITENYDATALVEAIAARKFTSEAVTVAFCKRAAIAQQITNCLTEIMFDEALVRAKYLDTEYKKTGKLVGPLHGVPISIKDSFQVKGCDTSIGLAAFAKSPSTENSYLVDLLLSAGAIIYVKTNVPQTLMALDSHNHIFGRVLNPANRACTAGGSSGGEGALIAMRGSILGVGTDIGGSIRIPSMCNGLYGLKPSCGRVPYGGQVSGSKDGIEGVGLRSCAGPIAGSLRDLELFMKIVTEAKSWEVDRGVLPGVWDTFNGLALPKRPLIGIVRTDGVMEPLPPVKAVINETAQALHRAGIDTVDLTIPVLSKCQSLANNFLGIDGNNTILDILDDGGEPLIPWLSTRLRRKPPLQLDKVLELHVRRAQIETEMLKVWKDKNGRMIDAFICPVAPHPVPPIDRWNGVSYTLAFNLLDYPAGVVPVRTLNKNDLNGAMEGKGTNNWDKKNRELWDENIVERAVYLNTSLCVQVVAPKLQERRLYEAMKIIDTAIKADSPPLSAKL
ncbi:general amidase-like protein [Xylogone sp. PMI_703]|nr:general amidase-like protein [Xylogone sp. PMI_703]